jgi:hypothetical protein
MITQEQATSPITSLATPAEQHMLFLFFPLKKGSLSPALEGARSSFGAQPTLAASQPAPVEVPGTSSVGEVRAGAALS